MTEITIKRLEKKDERAYKELLEYTPSALFFHSIPYKNFLTKILDNSQDYYILAYEGAALVGILPTFIKRSIDWGNVLNSLPFFGSHGGIIVSPRAKNVHDIKKKMLDKFLNIAEEENVISATIIDNFIDSSKLFYKEKFKYYLTDIRIGQITNLSVENINISIPDQLMNKFHSKTRNLIRKGIKSDFQIFHQRGKDKLEILHSIHHANMQAIQGSAKPLSVFYAIDDTFIYDQDYRIYFAQKNGEFAAALLVFYFKDYCEYFTPVVCEKYRSCQPLSALIFQAMEDAILRGCCWWNWGGTHSSQGSLYHFKSRWGAVDNVYHYYTKLWDTSSIPPRKEQMLSAFPYFYVRPFNYI